MIRLSCIIPTIGRQSLGAAIDSVAPQLQPRDELIVIGDGYTPKAQRIFREHWVKGMRYGELPEQAYDYGCSPCDLGIYLARGDFVWFVGDDDLCLPGAVEIIRKGLTEAPELPHLFAMNNCGRILSERLDQCHVSGQQIVVPRTDDAPRMTSPGCQLEISDWWYIQRVKMHWGEIKMHPELIATMEKKGFGEPDLPDLDTVADSALSP